MAQALPDAKKPKVFISHDSRDHELAEAFSNLLRGASGGTLKSFRSSDKKGKTGLEFGKEWYPAIMEELEHATDVVALLTPRSVDRPWILYEAGVAKGKLDTLVHGVAIGIPMDKAYTGPFAQFQNLEADEDSLIKLVRQLIERNKDADPSDDDIRLHVRKFLEKVAALAKQGAKAGEAPDPRKAEEAAVAKMFEEVKVMFRDLPGQVAGNVKESLRAGGHKRWRRFHPMMLEELLFHPAIEEGPDGPAAGWLLLITNLREDAPWLYEAGLELYHALLTRNRDSIRVAAQHVRQVVNLVSRGPMMREIAPEDREAHMVFRHLPEMLEHWLHRIGGPPPDPPRTPVVQEAESSVPATIEVRKRKPRGKTR